MPRKWGWLWRTKEFLFGRRKPVTIEAKVLQLAGDEDSPQKQAIPSRKPELVDEKQTAFWLLSSNEIANLRRSQAASGAAITLSEKYQGQLMSSQQLYPGMPSSPTSGLFLDVYPIIHAHGISVSASVCYSQFLTNEETITTYTNFAVSGRFEIPHGSALLILAGPPAQTNANRLGCLLIPSMPGKPKQKR